MSRFCLENHLSTDPDRLPPAPTYERGGHPWLRCDVQVAVEIVEVGGGPHCTGFIAAATVEGPWMPTVLLYPTAGKVYTIDA